MVVNVNNISHVKGAIMTVLSNMCCDACSIFTLPCFWFIFSGNVASYNWADEKGARASTEFVADACDRVSAKSAQTTL